MKTRFLAFLFLAVAVSTGVRGQQIVTVDNQTQWQTMDGFSGTLGWDYANLWWYNGQFHPETFERLKWRLFEDLKVKIVRVHSEGFQAEGSNGCMIKPKPTWTEQNDNVDTA